MAFRGSLAELPLTDILQLVAVSNKTGRLAMRNGEARGEIVSPGVNGAIVDDPADISALAAAVEPFLDPIRRGQASCAARAAAEQLPFSLNVQRTLDFLRRIQADKPGLAA